MEIEVKRVSLIVDIKENRKKHKETFEIAIEKYREKGIEVFEKNIERLKKGKMVDTYVHLIRPEDHTKDYYKIIGMLEMDIRQNIILTEEEYQNYVLDEWSWTEQWKTSTLSYINKK